MQQSIYLAFNSRELIETRSAVFNTLLKAGQHVFPSDVSVPQGHSAFRTAIENAEVSLHILGKTYEALTPGGLSLEQIQYNESVACRAAKPSLKIVIWFPFAIQDIADARQAAFIAEIRNNISDGITFTNTASPIQLAEDLRAGQTNRKGDAIDVKDTDVFLVYNQLDDNEAAEVADMLSDIIPVEKLNIIQDSDVDYAEFCTHQISRSKLAVVYFKESADWALPFTQQIWKKIGGAASHTPLLLIGDDDPETNLGKTFKAPKVVSLIVAGELIPLEIKVQYDKVIESQS